MSHAAGVVPEIAPGKVEDDVQIFIPASDVQQFADLTFLQGLRKMRLALAKGMALITPRERTGSVV
jgi:hypothetical protein